MRSLYTNYRWWADGQTQQMLVKGGRVVARGADVFDREAEQIDLQGQFLLPGFIDSHCHILPMGLDLEKLNLEPCSTKADVLDMVRDRLREIEPGEWLMAVHYDQTKFDDGEHLTRQELDAISRDVPILLRHVNGHASVANSAALCAAGVDASTPDPPGGSYRRDASGNPDGVQLETAHEYVTNCAPQPTLDRMIRAIRAAAKRLHGMGITCASDMMTGRFDLLRELEAYRTVAEEGCDVRFRLYMQWSPVFGPKAVEPEQLEARLKGLNESTCRVAGAKIFADGAIGSATAAVYGTYSGASAVGPVISRRARSAADQAPAGIQTSGQLIYSPERLRGMVRTAHEAGYQVAIHSIGDYSTDLVMDAYEELGDARRHRIEHAMMLSDSQIERMARIGCFCTMQPEFMMRFAHSYRRQLGPERMAKLERMRSVHDAGVPLSLSSDLPIVEGRPQDGIDTASARPDGFDPAEQLTRREAIEGYTREGAKANRDPSMGELIPGQWADFQLYLENPLTEQGAQLQSVRTGRATRS